MTRSMRAVPLVVVLVALVLLLPGVGGAEPLQTDLFVVVKPHGVMGKSPVYKNYRVADRSDPFAAKVYDTIEGDPRVKEVLLRYQRAQTESMRRYRAKLTAEGKSTAEIDKLLKAKAKPIPLVVKDGKATPNMAAFSAFIQTYEGGKLKTDFQYVCPKVTITKGWEGFSSKDNEPFSDQERTEFLNLIAHETGHAIMKETYGYLPRGINPFAAMGHWEGKETTPQLAFTEGYAEFMGAWYSGSDDYDNPQWNKDQLTGLPKTERENRRTEGVVACILWDIARGEGGIQDGIEKMHRVFREKRPWTITGFAEAWKKMYPGDAPVITRIMNQNLIPEKEQLVTCWLNVKSAKKQVDLAEASAAKISWWHPIKKIKALWRSWKAKSLHRKLLARYQSMYGFSHQDLTAPEFPKPNRNSDDDRNRAEATGQALKSAGGSGAPAETNPFTEGALPLAE